MSVAENKRTIRRFIDELMKGNRDIVEKTFSPNFAFHSHTHIDHPLRGLDGPRVMTSGSDLAETQVTIEDIFGEGDRVAVRWTFRGIYRGAPKTGLSPAGRTLYYRRNQYLPLRRRKNRRRLGSRSVLGWRYAVGVTRDLFPVVDEIPTATATHGRATSSRQLRSAAFTSEYGSPPPRNSASVFSYPQDTAQTILWRQPGPLRGCGRW